MRPGATPEMADVQVPEIDHRFDDIDVESILSKMEGRRPLTCTRKRCLYKAPEFVQKLPSEETVEEGATLQFDCKVTGLPSPTTTWSKDEIIFGDEERAEVKQGETGTYSLCFQDVSKCDEGTYRCRASNGEGVSTTSLYLSVKAKSKCRKRKKKNRTVASPPMFPSIVEHVVDERRETEVTESLPESPLTHLYDTISMRSPVSWPEFLGEWAYSVGLSNREDEDLECGSEDVFDSDSDTSVTSLPNEGLTFVTSPSSLDNVTNNTPAKPAGQNISRLLGKFQTQTNTPTKPLIKDSTNTQITSKCTSQLKEADKSKPSVKTGTIKDKHGKESRDKRFARITGLAKVLKTVEAHKARAASEHQTDLLNNNESMTKRSETHLETDKGGNSITKSSPPRTNCTVSTIMVNRSYAKGESTCSVATRREESPSRPMTYNPSYLTRPSETDTSSTLQNLSNQRILDKMRNKCYSAWKTSSWSGVFSLLQNFEDSLLELLFFISGSSFLALYFDLPPTTFMLTIFAAILIKSTLEFVLRES